MHLNICKEVSVIKSIKALIDIVLIVNSLATSGVTAWLSPLKQIQSLSLQQQQRQRRRRQQPPPSSSVSSPAFSVSSQPSFSSSPPFSSSCQCPPAFSSLSRPVAAAAASIGMAHYCSSSLTNWNEFTSDIVKRQVYYILSWWLVPGQLLIRIEAIAACCGPGHFLLQPAPELSNATKHRDGVIQRRSGASWAEACVPNLDVLVSALDGQGAATVSLQDITLCPV